MVLRLECSHEICWFLLGRNTILIIIINIIIIICAQTYVCRKSKSEAPTLFCFYAWKSSSAQQWANRFSTEKKKMAIGRMMKKQNYYYNSVILLFMASGMYFSMNYSIYFFYFFFVFLIFAIWKLFLLFLNAQME